MSGPILMPPILNEAQLACVHLLEEALSEAQRGNITSIGIICCMKGGFATVMAGMQAADLNLGCDDLKLKIHAAVTSGNVAKPKSNIIKARPAG